MFGHPPDLARHRDLEHTLCQIHSHLRSLHADSSFGLAFGAVLSPWQSAATPEGESIPSIATDAGCRVGTLRLCTSGPRSRIARR
jgi:hypothetical protein